jgi:hypothetical protein
MSPAQANAIAILMNTLLKTWEKRDHDARLRELETALVATRAKVKELLDQRER